MFFGLFIYLFVSYSEGEWVWIIMVILPSSGQPCNDVKTHTDPKMYSPVVLSLPGTFLSCSNLLHDLRDQVQVGLPVEDSDFPRQQQAGCI